MKPRSELNPGVWQGETPTVPSGSGSRGVREMLFDAETRRRGETRGEHLFRIGFRTCKAMQESQNLGARRQRRSYGFAARLTLEWKADQRSARRIPQRGLVHEEDAIAARCSRLGDAVVTARIWIDLGLASTRVHPSTGQVRYSKVPLPDWSRTSREESAAAGGLGFSQPAPETPYASPVLSCPINPPRHPSHTTIRKKSKPRKPSRPPKASVNAKLSRPARIPIREPCMILAVWACRATLRATTKVSNASSHGINLGLRLAAKWLMASWSGAPRA